jgi:hypothetical protein
MLGHPIPSTLQLPSDDDDSFDLAMFNDLDDTMEEQEVKEP